MERKSLVYTMKILIMCILFAGVIFLICVGFELLTERGSTGVNVDAMTNVRVVIDAGHGGRDGGASSENGILEKDLNLSLAMALYDFLNFCGVDSLMTRTDDSLVCDEGDPSLKGKIKMTDLKNRLSIAEGYPDAFFVSIHMNKFPIQKYSGLQVYYSRNNEKSIEIAKTVQESVTALLQPDNDRGVKAAGSSIFLLDRISIPAVLIECGFLSNPAEAAKLSSEEYRTKLALVIADSVVLNLESIGNN